MKIIYMDHAEKVFLIETDYKDVINNLTFPEKWTEARWNDFIENIKKECAWIEVSDETANCDLLYMLASQYWEKGLRTSQTLIDKIYCTRQELPKDLSEEERIDLKKRFRHRFL